MLYKLCNVKMMIPVMVIFHYSSCMSYERRIIAPFKPANCFLPENCYKMCGIFTASYPGTELGAWYFSDIYKACLPHYVLSATKNCCSGISNRPRTQKECEDMCGEPCIVTHANLKTEPGICQSECFIDTPPGVQLPCKVFNGWHGVNCCPRGYKAPSFLLEEDKLKTSIN